MDKKKGHKIGSVTRKAAYSRYIRKVREGEPQFEAFSDALDEAYLRGAADELAALRRSP